MTFLAQVRPDRIVPHDDAVLAKLPERVYLQTVEPKRYRSGRQNGYYFGVLLKMIADETGEDPDRIHEALATKFLPSDELPGGLLARKSTTELTTAEFEDYLARCRGWAGAELGIGVPLPNEGDNIVDAPRRVLHDEGGAS